MCDQKCSDTEECRYDKGNCEYKCVFADPFEEDEYFYSYSQKLTVASGLSAFTAAINFLFWKNKFQHEWIKCFEKADFQPNLS